MSELNVTERINTPEGFSERSFVHQPLLVSCTSDAPARCKLAKFVSHSGFLGCGSCTLRGTNVDTLAGGSRCGMHFLGYAEEAQGGLLVDGAPPAVSGMCGDVVFKLSHDACVDRAHKVDAKLWAANKAGCHGISPVIQHLDYTRYDRVFACSVAHAMLLGLLKDFWGLLLCEVKEHESTPWYSLPRNVRRLMADRASHVSSTLDQRRPYRCVVHHRGNWVMEDWLIWAEIRSVYIMSPEEQQVRALPCEVSSDGGVCVGGCC